MKKILARPSDEIARIEPVAEIPAIVASGAEG
jgi:hypothetical protein